jgi:IS1 family transposase
MHARPTQEQWVFGAFDTATKQGWIQLVQDRSANTLVGLIQEWCLPGTIIVSDGWAAYSNLESFGFRHEVVIHEQHFVDPQTGIHTNNVENFWQRCKRRLKWMYGTSRALLPSHLDHFLWLERYGHTLEDRWHNFFITIQANYWENPN